MNLRLAKVIKQGYYPHDKEAKVEKFTPGQKLIYRVPTDLGPLNIPVHFIGYMDKQPMIRYVNGEQEVLNDVQSPRLYMSPHADNPITDLDEYQAFAAEMTIPLPKETLSFLALKLAGEAGEVAEKIGKQMRGDFEWTEERIDDLMRELGDNMWYIANIAKHFKRKLSTVATMNRTKLLDRRARGVSRGEGDNR